MLTATPFPVEEPSASLTQCPWLNPGQSGQFRGDAFGLEGLRRIWRLALTLKSFLTKAPMVYTDIPLIVLCAAIYARRVKRIVEVNGIYSEEWVTKGYLAGKSDVRYHFMRALEGWAMRSAHSIIAVSPGIRDYLIHEFRVKQGRITVIPNGIDLSTVNAKDSFQLALPPGPLAVFVGSFRPWHGVDNLVRALPYALARVPSLKLILVGDGPARAQCEQLAQSLGVQKAVLFVGYQPQARAAAYISAADVCVYYPDYNIRGYGFMGDPIKLREYMAAGKPIVTIRLSNFSEIVEQEQSGVVVEPGHQRFGEALAELLSHPEGARTFGANGRRAVADRFDWSIIADRILSVLDDHPVSAVPDRV